MSPLAPEADAPDSRRLSSSIAVGFTVSLHFDHDAHPSLLARPFRSAKTGRGAVCGGHGKIQPPPDSR